MLEFLGDFLTIRDYPEIRGCLGSFNSRIFGFKLCICMENAGNGLLIGPKTWDRIMEIFLDFLDSRDSGCGLLGALYHNLFNKLCFGVYKIGNG